MAVAELRDWWGALKPAPRLALVLGAVMAGVVLLGWGEVLSSEGGLSMTEWSLWVLIGTLATLHRPMGGMTAGLGAMLVPLLVGRSGGGAVALVMFAVTLVAEWGRRLVLSTGRNLTASIPRPAAWARALVIAVGVLAGGVTWRSIEGISGGGLALVVYLAVVLAGFGAMRTRSAPTVYGRLIEWTPLGLDAMGWLLGWGLLLLVPAISWMQVGALAFVAAVLTAEAARQAILRDLSEHRVGDLEDLQQANARILSERFDMGEIALQVYIECRNILPVDFFQFEHFLPDGERSWSAGPQGRLSEGLPRPTEQPRPLPGIHRRANWHRIEETLLAEGRPLARLRLWCDPRRIEAGSLALFSSLLPQMAMSVHRAWLDREAKIDPLTGVPVRRVLERRTQDAYRESYDEGRSMAVVMCDIDHFKRVNDTYGHEAGDQALVLVAQTLDRQRREDDLCCRYGGEEFTLLLENTSGDQALNLAERLREAVEALDFVYEGQPIPLTISAGVAAFPELHIKTAGELRLLADEALYAAKNGGRNRCVLHLGRGRFRGLDERPSDDPPPRMEPPRIFG